MPLIRVKEPFDHPDWLFELKHDGFRALAIVEGHRCSLVSPRGYVFRKWARGPYHTDGTKTSWIKVKNPTYTQAEGRHEFFEDRAESRPRWKPVAYRMDPAAARAW